MVGQMEFVPVAARLILGIFGLSWVVACGVTAGKMEKEGIAFGADFLPASYLPRWWDCSRFLSGARPGPVSVATETVSRG